MLRYTFQDSNQRISFADHSELAPYFVAACASDPSCIEDLLLAMEPYSSGITARIMQSLLAYDAAISIGAKSGMWYAEQPAIEAADELSNDVALSPEDEGLMAVDLVARTIIGHGTVSLQDRGTVAIPSTHNRQQVAYVLSEMWTISVSHPGPDSRLMAGAAHD